MTCGSEQQPRLPLPSPASVQSTVKWVGSFAFRPVLSTPGPNTFTFWGWLPWPIRTYTDSQGSESHIYVTLEITVKSEHCLDRDYRKTAPRQEGIAPTPPGCSWTDRPPTRELLKTESFFQVDRFLKNGSRRAHLLEVHRRVLSA